MVALKPNRSLDEAELLAFCRDRLSGVNAPKAVHIWAEFPRSPVGKVLRREVRANFWQGRTRFI